MTSKTEVIIPEWVTRLEYTLFEGMPNEKAKEFQLKFLKSIPNGFSNWQHIYHQLCVFMLEKICKNIDHKIVVKAICDIITLHKTESKDESAWSAVRLAAISAGESAWLAAESAMSARSVRSPARSAWLAAESARSVRSPARSAWSAVRLAAISVESTMSAESVAESAVESAFSVRLATESTMSAAYYDISEELIRLFENEK